MLENLKKYHILLASKSPRRRELLQELRIPFQVITIGGIDESYPKDMPVEDIPEYIANKKADAYSHALKDGDMIITADTLVLYGDKVLGKPRDKEHAIAMLLTLSGRTHTVVSGVCIMTKERRCIFSSRTEVKFSEITRQEAEHYVNTYHPLDKAGAYGIQEWIGCVAVESINGSFYNVMGLPVHQLYQELKNF